MSAGGIGRASLQDIFKEQAERRPDSGDHATMDNGLRLAIKAAGNANRLAGKLGVSRQAVQQWRRIPTKRIIEVEAVTGVLIASPK
jgi:hypothetical protein